jgi:hypothetical protein
MVVMSAQVHQFPTDVDRLATIAKEIQQELTAASRSALESAIKIGEHLLEAKKIAGHGRFIPWLKQNFRVGRMQANKYIRAAQNADRLRANVNSEFTFSLNAIPALLADRPATTATKQFRRTKPLQKVLDEIDRRTDTGEDISYTALKKATGAGASTVCKATALREIAVPPPLPELSPTAQQKLAAWQKKLEAEFDYRVRLASQKWLDEVRIPMYEKQIDELEYMLNYPRNAVMTREEYNLILKCLHPDGLKARTEEQLGEAFRIFTKYKLKMASDPETRRATIAELPRTREELLRRKKQRSA